MKKFISLFGVAMMAMMVFTLFACGDDDDDIQKTSVEELTAVHKIKITVSGQTELFKWNANFKGMTLVNNVAEVAKIVDDNGKEIEYVENFSEVSGQTNKNGTLLVAAMLVTDFDDNNTGVMTIKMEGYINGKMTNAQTFTVRGGEQKAHSISFSTRPLD